MATAGPKKKGHRKQEDPFERAMEEALDPGRFIAYRESWDFVEGLQKIADNIQEITAKEPERSACLFEAFIAACHEKAEEIDDSSGNFGMLIEDLFRGWIKARQAAGADPEETADSLLAWMEDDPYGFCYDLDREAAQVLDRKGLEAFILRIRSRFESAGVLEESDRLSRSAARRWGTALKTLLAARGKVEEYIQLCTETQLQPSDCKVIAEIYRRRRRPEEALGWVERGLKLARTDPGAMGVPDLQKLKRDILSKLGRSVDALASAWSEFQEHPSTFTYQELMRYVPAGEKKGWHEKAMQAAERGDFGSQIELLLENKEFERLVTRLHRASDEELEALSHYRTEPLARKLQSAHPDMAARVYRALGLRIVNAGKSKYYEAALDNLANAKKCYAKAGLEADWEALVALVRERHWRKKGFMAGFEAIAAGAPPKVKSSFMDRARARSRFR